MKEPVMFTTADDDGLMVSEQVAQLLNKDFVHVKTGGVYRISEFIWDADTDQWAVLYRRKDNRGAQFKRLFKNFFDVGTNGPRFVQLDYGEQKPIPRTSSGGVGL